MTKKDGVDVNECDFFIKNRDKYLCRCTKINSFGDIVNPKNAENSNCLDNYNCYYKQLARKTQECEQIKEKYEALKLENEEGYEIVAELKHECEELEKQLETSEKWRIKAESLNENFELKNTCYRKALEEIEKYLQTQLDGFGNDVYEMQKSAINNIRNIISRAKEG